MSKAPSSLTEEQQQRYRDRLMTHMRADDSEGLEGEVARIAGELCAQSIMDEIKSHPDGISAGIRALGSSER